MAALSVKNREEILKRFADNVTRLSRINVGSTRVINGKRRKIDNSGRLRSSLSYILDVSPNSFSLAFLMEEYGKWVDEGRKPGKGIPPQKIEQWVKQKPIRPRLDGQFVKVTDAKVKSLAFLINRKIKEEGIEPTRFFTEPFEKEFKSFGDDFIESFALDVEEFLKFTTNGNSI